MTEQQQHAAGAGGTASEPRPPLPSPQAGEGEGQNRSFHGFGPRQIAYGAIAVGLVLVVLLIGTAPFWAPALPWGAPPARPVAAAPSAPTAPPPAASSPAAALPAVQPRSNQQSREQEEATGAALEQLGRRLAALEARPAAAPASDIADIRQQIAKLSSAIAELTTRVEAVDREAAGRVQSAATDSALVLSLLQIRDAVAAGRPFVAEYDAFAALSRNHAEIAAAAAPLAGPAKTGVASRDVLAARLHALAGTIAATKAPAAAPGAATGWADEALSRLRGLVKIRRIDGDGESAGPEAAVKAAEQMLAGGDLAGAIDKVDRLGGAAAEAADPWLRMAKQRVAVEAAIERTEAALATRLGAPAGSRAGGASR